jgi:hypothetical protein
MLRSEPLFDLLVGDLARGGSRREFVRRFSGMAAVFGLARAGVPARLSRPVATLFGVPAACENDSDCGDPCLICSYRAAGENKSCILKCQAQCTRCSDGQCVDQCPKCTFCYPGASDAGSTCESVEILQRCEKCDPDTGKRTTLCSACGKCENGECVSNCPNRCEICDNGTCRKCDRPCETCDEATGKCTGCSSACERCNPRTRQCETTCPGGRACCEGRCIKCCGTCERCLDPSGAGADFCPSARSDDDLACCATTGCVNLQEDRSNCGSCLHFCKNTETCTEGRCKCRGILETLGNITTMRGGGQECTAENHECCDGDCVDVARYQSDAKHCGKCVVECESDERCEDGTCVGSQRLGYRIHYQYKRSSQLRGLQLEFGYQAVVRQLRVPDADGNTFAARGTFAGRAVDRKANCLNAAPEDEETIAFEGRLKASGSVTTKGRKQILGFALNPVDPPRGHWMTRSFRRGATEVAADDDPTRPPIIHPANGVIELKARTARKSTVSQLGSSVCDGKVMVEIAIEVERIDPPASSNRFEPSPR